MRSWEEDPLLKVEHLTMRFGGLTAVDDVSFAVGRHDITALIGPNGAGKTTVFNCITGFYKPTEGMIDADASPTEQIFRLERSTITTSMPAPASPAPSRTSGCSRA